jgi:hypothetical protein
LLHGIDLEKHLMPLNHETAKLEDTIIFDTANTQLEIKATDDCTLLVLSGEPLNEPVVEAGPFVMNSEDGIIQAFNDFKAGKFRQSLMIDD